MMLHAELSKAGGAKRISLARAPAGYLAPSFPRHPACLGQPQFGVQTVSRLADGQHLAQ